MHEESDFLRRLLENPADDTSRLVYADWLDEQGNEDAGLKARFIRFEIEAARLPDESLRRAAVNSQLRKQAAALDPNWLAIVSHPALEECRLRFEFECPMKWENLSPTDDPTVRNCESCKRKVHYCDTIEEARERAWRDECVAVSLALVRRPRDLSRPMLAGAIALTPEQTERLGRANRVQEINAQSDPPSARSSVPPVQGPKSVNSDG
jgi:uncharacterized protein (TIGR02996 family)